MAEYQKDKAPTQLAIQYFGVKTQETFNLIEDAGFSQEPKQAD